ncbi:hypothetical protein TWF730_011096 [Orbilia blumenaviensis]|uniref:Uncharacterized protein n=1 Tax=Orbilia blumenaviensis TaxID=1796055 RepID=A0AAV9UQL0_9PEZI
MESAMNHYQSLAGTAQQIFSYLPNGTAEAVTYAAIPVVAYCGAPVVLGYLGFSAAGPVAGSLAAAWQSSIGVVQAGSAFSIIQGSVMTGAASVAGGAVGAIAPIAKFGSWLWGKNSTQCD